MTTTFDTIKDACIYWEENCNAGDVFAVQPTIHGVKLDFHVYVFDEIYINSNTYPAGLFSLCKSNDCATQVIVCKKMYIYTGYTLRPPYRCKGLIIHCSGTFYNNRGYVDMSQRGCVASGQNLYMFKDYNKNKYEYVPATGAAGGDGFGCPGNGACIGGNKGYDGVNRQSGGGGTGSARNWMYSVGVGRGGYGTSYSGGSGSGSAQSDGGWGGDHWSPNAPDNGGPGGAPNAGGGNMSGFSLIGLGGQGNPANFSAPGYRAGAGTVYANNYGTGGLIIIFAGDFNNNGYIYSKGSPMLTCTSGAGCVSTGGGSGGGSININYATLTNKGVTSAQGGQYTYGGAVTLWGGVGGNGCVTFSQTQYLKLTRCVCTTHGLKVPLPGEKVEIKAEYINDPLGIFTGFSFYGISEKDVTYDDESKLSFSFIMPYKSVEIVANYRLYRIICTRCSHNAPKIPLPGETYIITAAEKYSGEPFKYFQWSNTAGTIQWLNRLQISFQMPRDDVYMYAYYQDSQRKNTDIYKSIEDFEYYDYYNIIPLEEI